MAREGKSIRLSIRVTVVGMFLIMTSLTVAVAIGLQYYFSKKLATESSLAVYRQVAASTSAYLAQVDDRAVQMTGMLSSYPRLIEKGSQVKDARQVFSRTLQRNPIFYAIYLGFSDEEFYELVNLDANSVVRRQLQALPQDRWVEIRVEGKGKERKREFSYYDEQFRLRTTRSERTDYLPSKRPWYINAQEGEVYKTSPYLFQHLQAPGQTYSTRLANENAVLAVDIVLSSLSDHLKRQVQSEGSKTFLYQESGEIIASSESGHPSAVMPKSAPLVLTEQQQQLIRNTPPLTVSNETDWAPVDFSVSGKPYGYSIDILSLISDMTGLRFRYVNGLSWPELVEMFRNEQLDILQPVLGTDKNAALGEMSAPLLDASFGVVTRIMSPPVTDVSQLNGRKVAIPSGWSIIDVIRNEFPGIDLVEVAGERELFNAVRTGRADVGLDTAAVLNYTARKYFFNDVDIHAPLGFGKVNVPTKLHYIVQPGREGVREIINLAIANISDTQRRVLAARWLAGVGGTTKSLGTVPYPELVKMTSDPAGFNQLHRIVLNGIPSYVYIKAFGNGFRDKDYFAVVTPVSSVLAPAVAKVKVAILITAGCLLLLLPVSSWMASFIVQPVKMLALENEKIQHRRYTDVKAVDTRISEIDDLAQSIVRMARSIEKHARDQEALMESFIQIIAQAIDDKSPYTAGHCARVPELAMMLAAEADASKDSIFEAFHFDNEREWREFRIGAWLHDCGKVTTPEHIVDKGTKLETIYNRIHEIRMRFEVLWRDAEIYYLKQRLSYPEEEEIQRERLLQRQNQLREDFAFIAECNIGGEFMDEENISRLEAMAETTWLRHFDNRLGLSRIESERLGGENEALPVAEKLLADKPWHVIERDKSLTYPPHLGIKMDVPQHLYNLGELHNLRTSRGTLTPEDRFKINEHIISTIRMLDNLPLPPELEKVPRYASTHHETLDGRGYPRRLIGDELSVPERIMVLADIFEALTAADRPYKPAKPVSVAMDILYSMVQDKHVDRDVFELFLTSGVYRRYAERFLPPEQSDIVDIKRYIRTA